MLYRKYVSRCLETTLSTRKFELTDWNITGSDVVVGLGDILLFCKVEFVVTDYRICECKEGTDCRDEWIDCGQ